MFPRWLRISITVVLSVISLLILLWFTGVWYINTHKHSLLTQITEKLSEELNGTVEIENIKPVLWKSFPNVSVALEEVSVRDSLWSEHGRSLLELDAVFVRLNPFNLLRKQIDIRKLTLTDGYFCIFTDSSGYSNKYLLEGKKKSKKNSTDLSFRHFAVERVELKLRDFIKQKDFQLLINEMEGEVDPSDPEWAIDLQLDALVKSFCFNTDKGSFLRNARLKTALQLRLHTDDKILSVDNQPLRIDDSKIHLSAKFDFGQTPAAFIIKIHSRSTHFQTAAAWLSPSIYSKLDSIFFENPMDLNADIRGQIKFRDTPTVLVNWKTTQNNLKTPFADFSNCSFEGYFLNEMVVGEGHSDSNTVIVLKNTDAKWGSIPFRSDSIRMANLAYPLLEFHFATNFTLSQLNDAPVALPFSFENGQADVLVHYKGGVNIDDTLQPEIDGFIRVKDAAFVYLPRKLKFQGTNAELTLEEDNLVFKDISFRTPHSNVSMNGNAQDFFRFYFADPGKVTIVWKTTSESIDLADFTNLLGQRQQFTPTKSNTGTNRNQGAAKIFNQLDKVLDASNIVLDIKFKKVKYRNFLATNIIAQTSLSQSEIKLNGIRLHHAGGTISAAGVIDQSQRQNPFDITADVNNVAIDKLFHAFDNFGMNILNENNLNGRFSAKAALKGVVTDNGTLVPYSTKGFVDFTLIDGALINFEPLIKISKFAFKKRNLSHVVFKDIKNRLDIEGDKMIIHPMTIASSALYIDIKGVYGFRSGTDIALTIPLRNPAKDGFDVNEDIIPKSQRKRKGLTLYLRAKDEGDGNVKLSWDPTKRGEQSTDSILRKR